MMRRMILGCFRIEMVVMSVRVLRAGPGNGGLGGRETTDCELTELQV